MKKFLFLSIILSCLCIFASCMGGGDKSTGETNTGSNTDSSTEKCAHTNEEAIKGTPSTCLEAGLSDGIKCADCGEILEEQASLPLSDHSEANISGVSPTCTENGLTSGKKCSVCDEVLIAQAEIPATGHTEETIPGKAASCLKGGVSKGVKCSVCKEVLVEQTDVPALGHNFEYSSTVEPSCTYTGYDIYKCSNFGCKEAENRNEQPVAPDAHSYVPYTKEPTCTEAGYSDNVCEFCQASDDGITEPIQPLGHTYLRNGLEEIEYKITREPTCITAGEGWVICSDCDYCTVNDAILNEEYMVVIDATGVHDFSDTTSIYNEIPANCVDGGYTIYKCVGDVNCTATAPGTFSEPLGHDYKPISGKAPTDTEQGYTAHEECTRCSEKSGYYLLDTLDTARNIASTATITSTADWHAFNPSRLVDGDEETGTFSPLWRSYSIYFEFDEAIFLSYFNYVCTGKGVLSYPGDPGSNVDELTYCEGTCEVIFYDVSGKQVATTGQIDTSTVLNIDLNPNAFVKKVEIKYHWASHAGNEYMWEVYISSPELLDPKTGLPPVSEE